MRVTTDVIALHVEVTVLNPAKHEEQGTTTVVRKGVEGEGVVGTIVLAVVGVTTLEVTTGFTVVTGTSEIVVFMLWLQEVITVPALVTV